MYLRSSALPTFFFILDIFAALRQLLQPSVAFGKEEAS